MSSVKPIYQQALDSLRRREGLLRVMIFTLVTMLLWIGFTIYKSQTKSTLSIDLQKHTIPLNPNINREKLQDAASRPAYTVEDLQDFPVYDRVINDDGTSKLTIVDQNVISTITPSPTPVSETEIPLPEIATESATAI